MEQCTTSCNIYMGLYMSISLWHAYICTVGGGGLTTYILLHTYVNKCVYRCSVKLITAGLQIRIIVFCHLHYCTLRETQTHRTVSCTYGFLYSWFYTLHFFLNYFSFFPNSFSRKKSGYYVPYVTQKIILENREVFKRPFLANHARLYCMRTEQCYQRSFVIPSTFHETTTAS